MNPEMEIGTDKKALQINLDAKKYGTFAEIGAGQMTAPVARVGRLDQRLENIERGRLEAVAEQELL